jgi:hypothetical protein
LDGKLHNLIKVKQLILNEKRFIKWSQKAIRCDDKTKNGVASCK